MDWWTEDSEFFHVGSRIAPAGAAAARAAVRAKQRGDAASMLRCAQLAMDADRFANEARAVGRLARRGNVSGNAWSAWYSAITDRPSGW